ncbi:SLAM family member 7-like isoform X1 [Labeo rohita]|uniref:SLAM family member 7-like isoform X1 n=1 Tax=Labeo rohita TaxID=84645 RepID=A0A498NQJ5_LABRO|nr:SLAM family member 7-like isoform X1 [Labeo rohita]
MFLQCLTLVAICIVIVSTEAVSGQDEMKAVGDTVSFRPTNINLPVTSIICKQRSSSGILVKAIEWDDDGAVVPNLRFRDITALDEKTGQITITNLAVDHSGVYTIDINSKEQEQRFSLKVIVSFWDSSLESDVFVKRIPSENTEESGVYTIDIDSKEQEQRFSLKVIGQDEMKAVGDTVSFFRPTNINLPVTSIIWKHRSSSGVVVKAIEWDDDGVNIPNLRFKGVTTLDEKTGQITITNLTVEHSGVYTIDINSKEQEQRFNLEVIAPVPKPVIQIERSDKNPDVVYLICGYSEMIIWKNSAGETLEGLKDHLPGEFIMVKNKRNPDNFYTCTLKNAASEETSDRVYERDLFKGQDQTKPVGDTVSFHPTDIKITVTSIIWKQRSSSGVVVKAIEWDDDGFNIPNQRFKGITTLDEKTGQITITNLAVEHSGVYTIDINSKEQEQRFKLKVLKPVPQPVIAIERSTNPDVVYLRCDYSETIIWKNSAGATLNGTKNHLPGEIITVEKKGNPKNFYTCTLENALGNKTSDPVFEGDLFKTEYYI